MKRISIPKDCFTVNQPAPIRMYAEDLDTYSASCQKCGGSFQTKNAYFVTWQQYNFHDLGLEGSPKDHHNIEVVMNIVGPERVVVDGRKVGCGKYQHAYPFTHILCAQCYARRMKEINMEALVVSMYFQRQWRRVLAELDKIPVACVSSPQFELKLTGFMLHRPGPFVDR